MSTEVQDWSAYEVAEDEDVDLGISTILMKSQDLAAREQEFAKFKALLDQFIPRDDASVRRCGRVVERFKTWARAEEEDRKRLLAPHEKEVKRINGDILPVVKIFSEGARLITERVNKFLDDRRRAAELEQQRLLAEAAKKQAELDRKAQEAKDKAAQAAEQGDMVTAAVQESKALILEQKAAEVVPMQVAVPNGKVELETSTVSFGGAKKVWSLPGWDKESKLYADSSILDGVDMNWLRRFCVVDTVRLNAAFKSGEVFPKPFIVTTDYSKSRVR